MATATPILRIKYICRVNISNIISKGLTIKIPIIKNEFGSQSVSQSVSQALSQALSQSVSDISNVCMCHSYDSCLELQKESRNKPVIFSQHDPHRADAVLIHDSQPYSLNQSQKLSLK